MSGDKLSLQSAASDFRPLEKLKELYVKAQKMSPAALFSKILEEYRVYGIVEAEKIEVVYYTLELLRNAERSGVVVTLKDGADYIAELLSGNSDQERCLSLNDDKDAVHMANLHKVKGLEAPVVILSAVPQFINHNYMRIVHTDKRSEGYIFSLPKKDEDRNTRGSYFETKAFSDEHDAENAAGTAEGQRLVYVAATRARNVMIVCDSIQAGGKSEIHKTAWKAVKEDGLPDFFEAVGTSGAASASASESVDSSALYEDAASSCVLNDRSMEAGTYSAQNPSRLQLTSKVSDDKEADLVMTQEVEEDTALDDPKSGRSHRFPALLGTMTHKLMEMLVSTRNGVDADSAVGEIIREYRTPFMEPYEKELTKQLTDVARKMRSGGYGQTNGLPQDILNTLISADEVYCEVPFCYKEDTAEGKVLWNGIMDVVYCSQGKWHIVDYKTNADGNDLDKKYQAQLSAYVKAFKATTGEDADALTYHIDI